MLKFIRSNSMSLGVISALLIVLIIVFAISLGVISHRNEERKSKYDQQPASLISALDFSDRSKMQIRAFVDDTAEVVGVMAFRRHFAANEMPVFFIYSDNSYLDKFIDGWWQIQNGPKGKSSEELEKMENSTLNNTEEALQGKVRCVKTEDSPMNGLVPGFNLWAPTGCLVTFPPYKAGKETNIALMVLLSTPATDVKKVEEMKNKIFALQMDIDNRDYKGRETWVPAKR